VAYDEAVALRVRSVLKSRKGIFERKMFGGIAFFLNGHMCCGVLKKNLVLRLGEKEALKALGESHTHVFDFTGRPMKSIIYVNALGFQQESQLRSWVKRAVDFVRTLPPKVSPSNDRSKKAKNY